MKQNSKVIIQAFQTTSCVSKWFNQLKKELNKFSLSNEQKCLIYLKIAKGLYKEAYDLDCDFNYMQECVNELRSIING